MGGCIRVDDKPILWDLRTLLTSDTTTRRRMPALVVILLLAFAVSFWGLQYKLSLYHARVAHPAAPAAKLLSQKERPLANRLLEILPLSGHPFAQATRANIWSAVAALPANAQRTGLRGAKERDGAAETSRMACSRQASLTGPRAPPTTS
jgi:hypothetical protein